MKIIDRIFRKIGLILGLNFVGKYQKKWYELGGDLKFRYNFEFKASEDVVVFDLGAFDGEFSAKLLKYNLATIYAFDTNPYQVEKLKARFADSKNVRVFDFGLGAEDFFGEPIGSGAGASIQKNADGKLIVKKFEKFVRDQKITRINLLKINIEGAEYALIRHVSKINYLESVEILQIQFHDFVEDALPQLLEMHRILSETHDLEFSFPFVWDQWRLKV